jgi:ABC-type amino acid transport substrate-binding protein
MPKRGTAEHFEGIDIEVLSRVAEILGVGLEVEPISEPSLTLLLDDIERGKGDLAGGGLTVTPEREDRFSLSMPYHESSDLILVRADFYPTPEELWRSTAVVLRGSSFEGALLAVGFPKEQIHYVDFTIDSLTEILNQEADFSFVDSVSLPDSLLHQVRVAYRFGDPNPMVYLLPRGSNLKAPLDGALAAMKDSGELEALIRRHRQTVIDLEQVPKIDPESWCREGC